MVKALLNRYQTSIILFIWIIGISLAAYFILDQDKYYIKSHYEHTYLGDTIHYFKYTVNGKDKSFEPHNVKVVNGVSQNRLTRRARCDRWDKFIEQGYFKTPKKFAEGKMIITLLVCVILTPIILCNAGEHWEDAYSPCYTKCDKKWCRASHCNVYEYCPHSINQHWIFEWLRVHYKQFLGY